MKLRMLVPLHTYPVGNADNIAQHVAMYAQHLQADVCALACNIDLPNLSTYLGNLVINVPAMIKEAKAMSRARSADLLDALGTALNPLGIPLRALESESYPAEFSDIVAHQARYHDVVLVGMAQDNEILRITAEAVIFGSGRPVLLVPEAASARAPDHVVIAWDGGRVASRVVADAHAFLHRATTVTIVTVAGEKPLTDERSGERLAEYLADHDIPARVSRLHSAAQPVADVLQAHMRDLDADLLIMGAFGHSRMREFILGGATQGILNNLQVPVLVSH